MAGSVFWKGYLKLSLVSCPVVLTPAVTESSKLRFVTVNRKTGHRAVTQLVDAETGKPVAEQDEARGYARGEGDMVVIEDEELDSIALESTRTLDIETFVPKDRIPWLWYDKPHWMAPNDKVGEEAFAVIRSAMEATKTVGIARLVLYRRERAVMVVPRGKGMIVWTLRYADEVREAEPPASAEAPDAKTSRMLTKLIRDRTQDWSADMVPDPVKHRLEKIIAAKKRGKKAAKPKKAEATPSNVVNIVDALKASLKDAKK